MIVELLVEETVLTSVQCSKDGVTKTSGVV